MSSISNTKNLVCGENILLTPFSSHHVQKYSEWMQDKEILELTCSEPLSLEEVKDIQLEYESSENKHTFIILDKERWSSKGDCAESMIGDINFFIEESDEEKSNVVLSHSAEINVMIAEKPFRNRGFASETLKLAMNEAAEKWDVSHFVAKISANNKPSIALFKKMGFSETQYSEVFDELTYEKDLTKN
eukprot:GCRY01002167.1.p1 GENE.GCRY01002167.1~~GCRY01002167.1.p1  ORF type:complete len:189 (-),score=33.10 GCRY01002167.1:19-585(-)